MYVCLVQKGRREVKGRGVPQLFVKGRERERETGGVKGNWLDHSDTVCRTEGGHATTNCTTRRVVDRTRVVPKYGTRYAGFRSACFSK